MSRIRSLNNMAVSYGEPLRRYPEMDILYEQNQKYPKESILDTQDGMDDYIFELQKPTTRLRPNKNWDTNNYEDSRNKARQRINLHTGGDIRGIVDENADYMVNNNTTIIGPSGNKMEVNVIQERHDNNPMQEYRKLMHRYTPQTERMNYQTAPINNSYRKINKSNELKLLHMPLSKGRLLGTDVVPQEMIINNNQLKYRPDKYRFSLASRNNQEFSDVYMEDPGDQIVVNKIKGSYKINDSQKRTGNNVNHKIDNVHYNKNTNSNRKKYKKSSGRIYPNYDEISDIDIKERNHRIKPKIIVKPERRMKEDTIGNHVFDHEYRINDKITRFNGPKVNKNMRFYKEQNEQFKDIDYEERMHKLIPKVDVKKTRRCRKNDIVEKDELRENIKYNRTGILKSGNKLKSVQNFDELENNEYFYNTNKNLKSDIMKTSNLSAMRFKTIMNHVEETSGITETIRNNRQNVEINKNRARSMYEDNYKTKNIDNLTRGKPVSNIVNRTKGNRINSKSSKFAQLNGNIKNLDYQTNHKKLQQKNKKSRVPFYKNSDRYTADQIDTKIY